MKLKNKGKVHPSPPPPSHSDNEGRPSLAVLQLLPAAILTLISALSLSDREVLAYMITRSINSSQENNHSNVNRNGKSSSSISKKSISNGGGDNNNKHRFDCDCFDCYRSYWFRWDSSPNRQLIHQAIEAFEDHLAKPKKKTNRRDKTTRRLKSPKPPPLTSDDVITSVSLPDESTSVLSDVGVSSVIDVVLPECHVEEEEAVEVKVKEEEVGALVVRAAAVSEHKGLVRKVLPDVMGLFNSRLWSLWSPNA